MGSVEKARRRERGRFGVLGNRKDTEEEEEEKEERATAAGNAQAAAMAVVVATDLRNAILFCILHLGLWVLGFGFLFNLDAFVAPDCLELD